MKTATGLFLIALGAVLAFAVNGHPSFLNLQVVGWILIVLGAIGIFLPRRGYGWLRRQMVVKRGPDGRPVAWTRQRSNPPYMMINPATTTAEGTAAHFDRAQDAGTPVVPADQVPVAEEETTSWRGAGAREVIVSEEELVPDEEVIEEYLPE